MSSRWRQELQRSSRSSAYWRKLRNKHDRFKRTKRSAFRRNCTLRIKKGFVLKTKRN